MPKCLAQYATGAIANAPGGDPRKGIKCDYCRSLKDKSVICEPQTLKSRGPKEEARGALPCPASGRNRNARKKSDPSMKVDDFHQVFFPYDGISDTIAATGESASLCGQLVSVPIGYKQKYHTKSVGVL